MLGRTLTEDDLLLLEVAQGRTKAFEVICDRFSPAVYGVAKQLLRSESSAEAVTRDAMLEVWASCRSFDPMRGSALAWIMALAHRRAVDELRREQEERDLDLSRSPHPEYEILVDRPLQSVVHAQVHRALRLLTPQQRQALHMAYVDGFTHMEISAVLRVPTETVESRIISALRLLRQELDVDHTSP